MGRPRQLVLKMLKHKQLGAFLLCACVCATASAQEDPDRIQALEAKVAAMSVELAGLRSELATTQGQREEQSRMATDAELAILVEEKVTQVAALRQEEAAPPLAISGYFDLEFRHDEAGDKDDEFDQHRLILKLHADIAESIAFATEIEIEGGGVGAGHLTDSEIVVEFAELSFAIHDAFNFKAGALLVPFNRFNLLHDSPVQDLTDRPLVDRRIIPTTWAETGIGAYGAVYWDWGSLDYDVILGNGLTEDISASGGTRSARGSYREDKNDNKMIIGRVGFTVDVPFLDVLNVGTSIAHGKYDDAGDENLTMWGLDWTLKKGPFELVGEYANLDLQRGPAQVMAGVPGGMEGFYVEGRFHFFPDSWRGSSAFFTDQSTFTLVARYGEADTDEGGTAVDFGTRGDRYRDDRRRFTFGFNFRPVESTVFKFEYQWFLEPSGIPDVKNDRFVASVATYF